ncbi:SpoIIE family protein phosphatase [Kitasatospora sp. NPDC059571]|uniref:SpoIIE family protein phosphatase n=1 Tax=Kitasatospora sp. NPDC059571 TaxID=3346871 RepID=UPI0036BF989E
MPDPTFHGAPHDLPDATGEAFAVMDAGGVLTGWSPGAQHLLGYPADEVLGRRGADLVHPRADAGDSAEHRLPDHAPCSGRVVLRHRDGSPVEVVIRANRLHTRTGGPQWLLRADSAASARRRAFDAALLDGLLGESPFLIDVFDTELRFVVQSRAAAFSNLESVGRTMREVAPAGLLDVTALEARQRRVLASGEALVGTEVHGRLPDDPDREHVWSETILPLRDRSGEVIGLAHAVSDVTEQTRARDRLALINDASTKIGSTLDVLHTAQELTDVAVPLFADHAYVSLLGPVFGGEEPVTGPVAEGVPLRRAASSTVPGGSVEDVVATGGPDPFTSGAGSVFSRALERGEPLLLTGEEVIAATEPLDPRRAAVLRAYGVHSWLLVPMSARGAVLGVVVFARFRRAHAFESDDVPLAREFVARAAVCIDNASRYTRERTTALALQHSLLPRRLPSLGAVDCASRYLPASGHMALGGGWFDVIALSGARVALVVGDAVGHGLHSAVTMGRLRTAVRTLADLDLPPEELLTHLDDQVSRFHDGPEDGLAGGVAGATCVYAVFDPMSRRCVLARAGHAPPALVSADGRVRFLDPPAGPALGLGGAPFESSEVTLADGDLLVLYTKGLVESRERGVEAGLERLREALSAPGPGPSADPDDVCDEVLRRLLPPRPQDDVALLAARVRGLGPDRHATWELRSDPGVVREARALATGKLAEWGLEELEFTTELVVSELVTNAVRYGRPPIRLRLIRDRSLICEVSDGSSTSPHIRRALETDEGGRGLFMVAQFVRLWGTRYHARGKTIWAEQSLPEVSGDAPQEPRSRA